jgi:hypothetical protein
MLYRNLVITHNAACTGPNNGASPELTSRLRKAKRNIHSQWLNGLDCFLNTEYDPDGVGVDLWFSPHPANREIGSKF